MDIKKEVVIALGIMFIMIFISSSVIAVDSRVTISIMDINPWVSNISVIPSPVYLLEQFEINASVLAFHGYGDVLSRIGLSNGSFVFYNMTNSSVGEYTLNSFLPANFPIGLYNVTIFAYSPYGGLNDSEWQLFNVSSHIKPAVVIIYPKGNSFNQGTGVPIQVQITDPIAIDTVYANFTYFNNTQILLLSYDGQYYSGTFSSTSNLGSYNFSIFANDTAGNFNDTESNYFVIVQPPQPTPSGGGGGGGGGGGTLDICSKSFVRAVAGWIYVVKCGEGFPVNQLETVTNVNKDNFEVAIKKLIQPTYIVPPSVDTNSYFEVSVKNLPNEETRKVTITFQIDKKWVEEHGIKDNVVLLKTVNGQEWVKQDSKFVEEKNGKYIYTARVDSGKGVYAISIFSPLVDVAPAGKVIEETYQWCNMAKGTELNMDFNRPELAVSNMKFILIKDLNGCGNLIVKEDIGKSGLPGMPYKYFTVDTDNLKGTIGTVQTQFAVSKEWLENNNINSIGVYKYENGQWVYFKPEVLSENALFVNFKAEISGIGLYGITGFVKEPIAENVKTPEYSMTGGKFLYSAPLALLFIILIIVAYLIVKHEERRR